MPHHPIAIALIAAAVAGCTQPGTAPSNDRAATPNLDALVMREGAEQAQATLRDFLVKARELPAGTTGYALRVRLQEAGDTEYFWVREFSWSDDMFTGRIDREPRRVKRIRPGQPFKFARSDIVDWTYVDQSSGKRFGNFTGCAPLAPAPAGQADASPRQDADCR